MSVYNQFYTLNPSLKIVLLLIFVVVTAVIALIGLNYMNLLTILRQENAQLRAENQNITKRNETEINKNLQDVNAELNAIMFENYNMMDEHNKTMDELNQLNEKLASSHTELELQKQDLFDLYHNAPCGYFTVNAQGILTSVNRTALKWIGYKSEEVLDMHTFDEYLMDISKKIYTDAFTTAPTKGGFFGLLLYAVSKNGIEMPFVLNAFALLDENNEMKLLRCTCYDMRERIKYEKEILEQKRKAEEANETKNVFLSKMSHELRTPLHGIIGNLSLLKKHKINDDKIAIINNLELASEKMSSIINDIFDTVTLIDATFSSEKHSEYIILNHEAKNKLALNSKILIVDDENLNQKLLLGMLNQLKLNADTADNGRIAVEMFQKNQYDLILMDISMPEMNGIDASKAIMSFGNKKPIIIAITANIIKYEKQEYFDAGIQLCLTKPTRFDDFLDAINPYFEIDLSIESHISVSNSINKDDILDYAILNQILETAHSIGNDFEKVMLAVAKKEIPTYTLKVKEFLDCQNQKELVDMLHKLKGASWTSGMKKAGDLCKDYETKVKQNDFTIDAVQLITLVDVSLKMLEEFYENPNLDL